MGTETPFQQKPYHEKKFNEAISYIRCHPRKNWGVQQGVYFTYTVEQRRFWHKDGVNREIVLKKKTHSPAREYIAFSWTTLSAVFSIESNSNEKIKPTARECEQSLINDITSHPIIHHNNTFYALPKNQIHLPKCSFANQRKISQSQKSVFWKKTNQKSRIGGYYSLYQEEKLIPSIVRSPLCTNTSMKTCKCSSRSCTIRFNHSCSAGATEPTR